MKKFVNKLTKVSIIAFVLVGAQGSNFAHAGEQPQAQAGGNNAPQAGTASYTVRAYLSRQNNVRGELEVIDNSTGQVIRTCDAIGGRRNHPDGAPSRPTPSGRHRVDRTSNHLDYQGRANAIRNVYSTYFTSIFGRPVAIHKGNLNSNSHACIRVSTSCAQYIKAKAEASHDGRRYNMTVDVSYVR